MASTSANLGDISVQDEDALLTWFFPVPEAGYGFCSRCGSSLFWQSSAFATHRAICAGTLEPPTGLRTVQAWWISQASDYHERHTIKRWQTDFSPRRTTSRE